MDFLATFWNYLTLSAPFLLLGLLVAGLAHTWTLLDSLQRSLRKDSWRDVVKASLIGVPLPLCSCAVIPAAVGLRKAGASRGATSSFLIATPESGIDSVAMTYALMDLPMAVIRPVAAFCSALVAGIFPGVFNQVNATTRLPGEVIIINMWRPISMTLHKKKRCINRSIPGI